MDSVLESPGTRQLVEDSITAADGVRGGERLATMVGSSIDMPGATVRATESSTAEAGAADVMPESMAQKLAVSEEQAARPEMPQGMVGRSMQPPSPREHHWLWRKRMRSRRLSVKDHDLKPSAASASEGTKLWPWKRRTPLGR